MMKTFSNIRNFGFAIVTRTGIEKIMSKDDISLDYEVIKCESDFAAVKCTATMLKGNGKVKIPTFGTASKANCQSSYFLEMAEKRSQGARNFADYTILFIGGV